jgi:trk system potassium uptake protein TrkA
MLKKVAVFGLGQFGASVAVSLCRDGVEVLAVDRSLRLVEQIQDEVSVAVAFDATDRENLLAYDVGSMDAAIVAIGTDFEAAVLVTVLCKELGVPYVVVKVNSPLRRRVLQSVGADLTVMPEEEMGHRLAEHLAHESVVDFVELPKGYSLRRLPVPKAWADSTLADLSLLKRERLNLIQVVRAAGAEGEEPERIPLPHGEIRLHAGDFVDVIGPDDVLNRFS